MTTRDLGAERRDYESRSIGKQDMHPDPMQQFEIWMQQALEQGLIDATAMTLATASADGIPSARIVLLKQFDENGFCWYSDAGSLKGQQLSQNPQAALLIHWREQSRQVRVQGTVEQLPDAEVERYFHSRPQESRFSAAASQQSAVVSDRTELETEVQRLHELYPDGQVPRPSRWVGYRLKPRYFEFWQGLVNRLHDRLVYRANEKGWTIERLSP